MTAFIKNFYDDVDNDDGLGVSNFECFDTVGWVTGRTSGP